MTVLRALLLGLLALLAACSREPLPLAFVGGITGRSADLGVSGRDGALLAVEQANASGGVRGRLVELVSYDDRQDAASARQAFADLVAAGHRVAIGPMTSVMAMELVPLANRSGVLLVSPTVTTSALSGLDDQFFRVVSSVEGYARRSAEFHCRSKGLRRFAVVVDDGNKAYSRDWALAFGRALADCGGQVVSTTGFAYTDELNLAQPAQAALAGQPDAVLLIANAVDAAQLAQAIRKRAPQLPLVTSEWAATEQFIALGGRAVEGIFLAQFLDRDSQQPSYRRFITDYKRRFGREPGFPELAAFDAAGVVLRALAEQQPDESLKATLLRLRRFDGAQHRIEFDANGDSQRGSVLTEIRNGRYLAVH